MFIYNNTYCYNFSGGNLQLLTVPALKVLHFSLYEF
jgi:hypothetical protein